MYAIRRPGLTRYLVACFLSSVPKASRDFIRSTIILNILCDFFCVTSYPRLLLCSCDVWLYGWAGVLVWMRYLRTSTFRSIATSRVQLVSQPSRTVDLALTRRARCVCQLSSDPSRLVRRLPRPRHSHGHHAERRRGDGRRLPTSRWASPLRDRVSPTSRWRAVLGRSGVSLRKMLDGRCSMRFLILRRIIGIRCTRTICTGISYSHCAWTCCITWECCPFWSTSSSSLSLSAVSDSWQRAMSAAADLRALGGHRDHEAAAHPHPAEQDRPRQGDAGQGAVRADPQVRPG